MNKRSSLATLLAFLLFANSFAQTREKPSAGQQSDQEDVVRITTNLVQIDAVVTDKKGRLVTDLTAEDFEVYEDGRPQKITNFSFIPTASAEPAKPPAPASADKTGAAALPQPPVRLQEGQVRRTIALVVDDLCLSWVSANYVRKALKKYLDEQMQPGDLVAIIRTAGGMGVLQQFTSDKRQLYAAVERVKWYPAGCNGIESFQPLSQLKAPQATNAPDDRNDKVDVDKDIADIDSRAPAGDLNKFRVDTLAVGTLGALSYVVRGMKDLPGRKSVLFISDGFSLRAGEDSRRILDAVDRVTDLANRSSVVIYTMDARGLVTTSFTAADSALSSAITGPSSDPSTPPYNKSAEAATQRSFQMNDTQSGLIYLAKQTGGFPVVNSNDLANGIKRVMDDQRGYYLVGYRPEESTFDPNTGRRRFHQFSLKVKRPGLNVRTRKGFYGVTDETIEASASALTRGQQLVKAIVSPFKTSAVDLRLTSLFGNDARTGSYMRSLLYINARDLTFTEEADGWHKTVMDVMAITFGDNGQIVDEVNKTQTIRVRGETYKSVLKDGLVYFMNVPVKRAGAYQLRMAVRDAATERVGSASQFIEVPDLSKKRLTISGIVVNGYEPKAASQSAAAASGAAQNEMGRTEGAQEETDPQASAAVRRLRTGMVMNYAFVIYNAQLDKATRRPQIQTQLRLFRDGQPVFTGRTQLLDASRQLDPARLIAGGGLQIGSELTPGEYVLQIIVTDLLANQKYRTATQWIDFEVVK